MLHTFGSPPFPRSLPSPTGHLQLRSSAISDNSNMRQQISRADSITQFKVKDRSHHGGCRECRLGRGRHVPASSKHDSPTRAHATPCVAILSRGCEDAIFLAAACGVTTRTSHNKHFPNLCETARDTHSPLTNRPTHPHTHTPPISPPTAPLPSSCPHTHYVVSRWCVCVCVCVCRMQLQYRLLPTCTCQFR
jgi:hypothetical protein